MQKSNQNDKKLRRKKWVKDCKEIQEMAKKNEQFKK